MIGAVDGKAGAFAWRGKLTAGDASFRDLFTSGTTNRQIQAQINSANNFIMSMRNAANVVQMTMQSSGVTLNVAAGDLLILASWDVASNLKHLYINDVSRLGTNTLTDDVLKFATTQAIGVLAESDGAPATTGETDYVYFGAEYIDLSNSATRAKFSSATDMSYWGKGPTGNRPLVYAWGDAASWNGGTANKGGGGPFTATGAFTDA